MSGEGDRPWRRRLQRYGPWAVAAVAIVAILVEYPPERIAAEMTRGTINRQQELGALGLSLLDLDSFDTRIAAIETALEKNPG